MPIPSSINDFNETAASNYPADTDTVGTNLAALPRAMQAIIKKQFTKGSALTVLTSGLLTVPSDNNLFAVNGTGFNITGLSNSTFAGRTVKLNFVSAGLTLVNSTTFKLPDALDIVTKAGDVAEFIANSTGVWICTNYKSYVVNTFIPNLLEIGNFGSGINPRIDLRSSAAPEYSARLLVTGGTATNGTGTINVLAGSFQFNGEQVDAFPTGTRIVFYQAAAPTGWTKLTLNSNYVLITGTGGTTGGVATHNIVTGCNVVASHTHTINPALVTTSSHAGHAHDAGTPTTTTTPGGGFTINYLHSTGNTSATTTAGAHTHTVDIPSTVSTTNTNLDVWQPLYYTVIVGIKS